MATFIADSANVGAIGYIDAGPATARSCRRWLFRTRTAPT